MLFALSAARITYTTHLAPSDPLNNGHPFTDPIVILLLITSLFLLLVCPIWVWVLWKRVRGWYARVWIEVCGVGVMWVLLLIGMAISTSIWPNLGFCANQVPCAVLQAMIAFAWLAWILLSVIIGSIIMGIISARAFGRGGWRDYVWEDGTRMGREPVFQKMGVGDQAMSVGSVGSVNINGGSAGSVGSGGGGGAESVGGEGQVKALDMNIFLDGRRAYPQKEYSRRRGDKRIQERQESTTIIIAPLPSPPPSSSNPSTNPSKLEEVDDNDDGTYPRPSRTTSSKNVIQ
ncbi:hypothetical protein SISSUDRAFT_1037668 [Sistotremastrum suecicum HHB10207 ss-3]|uniref:Uncharacterized protein n=1 Tax=Sistotremastrum suecicum HHB10207 ss-3 TaxID=1314776 RepID=A0A165XU19_9AGAM|nr:hypothetical protein SISSUDRAFT_1037668 [Sistotremastrum suecicum HHB10207 ss-3]